MSIANSDLAALQSSQQQHDLENHLDILALHKMERLKHYGLHYAKYVGRFARGAIESKSAAQTLVDTFLVSLSAANTLNQRLSVEFDGSHDQKRNECDLWSFADATGRFADACEKLDHLEEFRSIALKANLDIVRYVLLQADRQNIDLQQETVDRRRQLYARQVYHGGA